MEITQEDLLTYAEQHTAGESPLLARINRETHLHVLKPQMLSGHLQGRFLAMISQMIRPETVLEIGTYTGYSALCIAEGLAEDGRIITIEKNEQVAERAQHYFNASAYSGQIELKTGIARDIIKNLSESWDLIFIDADKENYPKYYEMTVPHVRKGGLILIDNVLWYGKVIDKDYNDKDTKAIREINAICHKDERVENLLVPIRDGLMMLRKL